MPGTAGKEVRTDEERSDELTTLPQEANTTRARTSIQDTLSCITNAISLIPHP